MIQRVLIVDDEPPARTKLARFVARCAPAVTVAEAGDGPEAVRRIIAERPDLVFLDIQMPGMNGLEVLESLGADELPAVIFTTAFDHYAVAAFEHEAVDYLLKPFDADRFQRAWTRANARIGHAKPPAGKLLTLTDSLQRRDGPLRRLFIRQNDRIVPVNLAEVSHFSADDKYVVVHANGRTLLLRQTLAALEPRLDPVHFARTHRSYLVNLDHVRDLRSWSHGDYLVTLRDGTEVPLGRRHAARLLERFGG